MRMIGGGAPGSAGYYDELVNYAVRFTFSGDYYHAAPWSVVNQGTTNVSHGCVNLPPEDAGDLLQPDHPRRPDHRHRQHGGRASGMTAGPSGS